MTDAARRAPAGAGLFFAMAALFAALMFIGAVLALPPLRAENAPGAFNAPRALERLARILGDERAHPVDSDANDAVRERLLAEIEALGYAPQVRDDFMCRQGRGRAACARVRNIVFRAGPEEGEAVMLSSHYDSVPAGPGAADDGIGVAVSLEIAGLLAEDAPARPVIFLITDGEEAGLLGAASFAEKDPLADDVAAVVNLEARGVRGPAQMFETSVPNGRDVAAFAAGATRPFSNSLMTDIYRLMPNDTDLTMFLPLGYDAANMALTDGLALYHTPRDNLAALDPKSVQHMGDQALGTVRGFLAQTLEEGAPDAGAQDGAETHKAFADILSRGFLVIPQWLSLGVVWGALALAGLAFLRDGGARPLRAALVAPATLVGAGALVFVLQWLVGALRPETLYWYAWPQAMRALCHAGAIAAALGALAFIGAGAGRARLVNAAWFWFAAFGAGVSLIAPGGSILFAMPLALYGAGVVAGFFAPRARLPFAVAAAVAAVAVMAPDIFFSGITLGFAVAPVFAVLAGLLAATVAPLAAGPENRPGLAPLAAATLALCFALGTALVVPAYSRENPQPVNLQYFVDADAREALWLLRSYSGPPPRAMLDAAPFEAVEVAGLSARLGAPASFLETTPPEAMVLANETREAGRRVRLRLIANGADEVLVQIPAEAGVMRIAVGGRAADHEPTAPVSLRCAGRACDGVEIEIDLANAAPLEWLFMGVDYGLPFAAAPLVSARPDNAVPIHDGDMTIVRTRKNV